MKTKLNSQFMVLALLAGVQQTLGQAVVINSLSQNGVLVCSGLQTGTVATVEWASSLAGPWQTNWSGLTGVAVATNGTITVSVPMFYRVLGVGTSSTPAGMASIPAGTFTMGNSIADSDLTDGTPTNVYVSAFYMDVNLVTSNQWAGLYNYATNHGYSFVHAGASEAANHPVQSVDWFDCVKWSNARSQQAGLPPVYFTDEAYAHVYTNGDTGTMVYANWAAKGYRLPTEAEWEKAARGGLSGQRFPWGNTISESQANYFAQPNPPNIHGYIYDLGPYTGYNTNFDTGANYTSPAGYFAANGYGLYDMAGNVCEWCWDWYATPYGQTSNTNPTGPVGPLNYRVFRGGNWDYYASTARCAARGYGWADSQSTYIGFRCVRGL